MPEIPKPEDNLQVHRVASSFLLEGLIEIALKLENNFKSMEQLTDPEKLGGLRSFKNGNDSLLKEVLEGLRADISDLQAEHPQKTLHQILTILKTQIMMETPSFLNQKAVMISL